MIAAISVATAANVLHKIAASVRWPNDVVVGDKKIAGTSAEAKLSGTKTRHVVLGLGVNTNFAASALGSVASCSTTIADVAGHEINNAEMLANTLQVLERLYVQIAVSDYAGSLSLLQRTNSTAGRRLKIQLNKGSVNGVFERHLTLSKVRILDDRGNHRDVDTSEVVQVEYLSD